MKMKLYTTLWEDEKIVETVSEPAVTCEADEPRPVEMQVLNLYPQVSYQKVEGFGGAMTEAAGYALSKLSDADRKAVVDAYYGEGGIGSNLIRVPLDSCDYSLEEYQAVADPIADPDFKTFDMSRNFQYILPALKEAVSLCGRPVSVLLSPWSPPAQWKTPPEKPKNDAKVYGGYMTEIDYTKPQRNHGGSLKPEYYGPWAKYLVKLVNAYLDEGIPVTMLSVQNESIAATNWDSCVWTAEGQKAFIRDYLYPEMEKAGLLFWSDGWGSVYPVW